MRAVAVSSSAEPPLDQYRMRDVVYEYLAALRVAGRSPRTIEWYRANLAEYMRFVERDGGAASIADLQPAAVRRWLLALNARPTALAPSSLAGRVRTIKAFGTWIASEFDLSANPVRGVPIPRVPDQLVPSLRDHEIARLIQATSESRHPQRDLALILLMIDTGMRLSEVAGLNVGDVNLIEGRCRAMGKGSRERVVPIGRRTRQALRAWSSTRRPGPVASSPLFVGHRGSGLSARGIHQLVGRLARRAGLETRCSPHVLRHTFARAFLTNGGDEIRVPRIRCPKISRVRCPNHLVSSLPTRRGGRWSPHGERRHRHRVRAATLRGHTGHDAERPIRRDSDLTPEEDRTHV